MSICSYIDYTTNDCGFKRLLKGAGSGLTPSKDNCLYYADFRSISMYQMIKIGDFNVIEERGDGVKGQGNSLFDLDSDCRTFI